MKRFLLCLLLLCCPALAQTDQFGRTPICVGDGPVTCTVDGISVMAPTSAAAIGTLNGMAPSSWTPTPIAPTTIPALAFIQRFTPTEQSALTAANPLWPIMIAAAGTIDVTNATLLALMQQAVASGALTQARATQVLDLAVQSP